MKYKRENPPLWDLFSRLYGIFRHTVHMVVVTNIRHIPDNLMIRDLDANWHHIWNGSAKLKITPDHRSNRIKNGILALN